MIDFIAIMTLAAAARLGWTKGTVWMIRPIGALVAGYLAALLLFKPVGWLLGAVFGWSALVALPLGGFVGLIAGSMAFRRWARTWGIQRERPRGVTETTPTGDRLGGLTVGVASAVVFILIAVWGGRSMAHLYGGPRDEAAPARLGPTARLSAAAAERTVYTAMRLATGDRQVAASMSGIIARPGEAVAAVRRAARSPRLAELAGDRHFGEAFLRGDARGMRFNGSMVRLLQDEAFLDAVGVLRLVPADARTPERVAEELGRSLAPIGRTVSALGSDVEFLTALAETDARERLARGEFLGVAADPEMEWLLQRATAVLKEQRRTFAREERDGTR